MSHLINTLESLCYSQVEFCLLLPMILNSSCLFEGDGSVVFTGSSISIAAEVNAKASDE